MITMRLKKTAMIKNTILVAKPKSLITSDLRWVYRYFCTVTGS